MSPRRTAPRTGRAFRELGIPAPPSPASTARWFATAPSFDWRRSEHGEWGAWPTSVVHAKEMGTTATACGLSTHAWRKFWHLTFPVADADPCPACRAHVTGRPAQVRSGDGSPPHGT